MSLQPSELAKLAFIIYLADWCSTKGEKVRDFSYGLMPFGIMLGLLGVLVFMEPDMGTTLVIFAIGVVMYFVSGAAGSVRTGDVKPSAALVKGYDRDLSFMLVEISGNILYFQTMNRAGETIDSGHIVKKRTS